MLLGNQAIVRGALEAGLALATTYPGTPASEIGDTLNSLASEAQIYFEYAVNEKVALELAAAAAVGGARSLCAMKHVGVNVAADPLMTFAYTGTNAGFVLVSADDPGCHSSQNEQDNRYYARLSGLPLLEPHTPDEARRMTAYAFDLSEQVRLPVILRTTTRLSHARGTVTFDDLLPPQRSGVFQRDPQSFVPVPAIARKRHPVLIERLERAAQISQRSEFFELIGEGPLGLLSSGAVSAALIDICRELDLLERVTILRLGVIHPWPEEQVARLIQRVQRVLVIEELEPYMEEQLQLQLARSGKLKPVLGKHSGHTSRLGELGVEELLDALGRELELSRAVPVMESPVDLPGRPPQLCAGCPHRATYFAVKLAAGPDALYMTDIGCYTLGFAPPIEIGDLFFCMGASINQAVGMGRVVDRPMIAFIGDSTLFHSGLTGVVNAVRNAGEALLVVLDNSTTGMTGHQPHPGSPDVKQGQQQVDIEAALRGLGVRQIRVVDPSDARITKQAVEELLELPGLRVLISRSPCPLFERRVLGQSKERTVFEVDPELCRNCGMADEQCHKCEQTISKGYELERARRRVEHGPQGLDDYLTGSAAEKMLHPPCSTECPLTICVQGYITQLAAGDADAATALVRQRACLPGVLGRVCHRPCEAACVRNDFDEPVAICDLKAAAAELESDAARAALIQRWSALPTDKGRVAVIGSGPAGLAGAFDLRLRGFQVRVFDAQPLIGGIPAWAIPEYRLPRAVLERDLQMLQGAGIEFESGRRIDDLAELFADQYDALLLACGAMIGTRPGIEGETATGCISALEMLRAQRLGSAIELGDRVLVIGGGNAAIDAARVALRLGASGVKVVYRRGVEQMPADAQEIADALEEGVELLSWSAPTRVLTTDGRVAGLEIVRTEPGRLDASGRARPVVVQGSESVLEANSIVFAVGQRPLLPRCGKKQIDVDKWGWVRVDEQTGATSVADVFAAGDVVSGPSSVVQAMAAGKRAAYGIDLLLSADPVLREIEPERERWREEPRYAPGGVTTQQRISPPQREAELRSKDFEPTRGVLDIQSAQREARRCLTCGICATCQACLDLLGCPAFVRRDGKIAIDPVLCDGCGVCVQVCPNGAIRPVKVQEAQ
ncbi:MAG: FAD-dependent oxidoreductase [Candidatus Alcyoniella australis]|nr:FAD-dependent oxidoreductase [Candidatus Alcyoniella australis]